MSDRYRRVQVMFGLTATGMSGAAIIIGMKAIGEGPAPEFGCQEAGNQDPAVGIGEGVIGEGKYKI